MVSAGAAVMREEDSVSGPDLWSEMLSLLGDEVGLGHMANASRRRGRPDAADRIAAELLRLAGRSEERSDV
jgi:UDP-N-acetylglucosamine:LPS N-acetylglucosamine transferase